MDMYEFINELTSDIAEVATVQDTFAFEFGQMLVGEQVSEDTQRRFRLLLFLSDSMAKRLEELKAQSMCLFDYERKLTVKTG